MKRLLAAGAALVAAVPVLVTASPAASEDTFPVTQPPNVIVIVTDDQTKGTEDAMPNLRNEIVSQGLTFTNGITPTALCCPSRVSLLTGNQAHTTGVYDIANTANGGWGAFHNKGAENNTLATQLDALGYRTGLFGKYLNGYNTGAPQGFVPPGWDTFHAIESNDGADGTYYNYRLTGLPNAYGNTAADYSTDVTGALATDFVASTPADTPFFVFYTPFAGHAPFTPAPRDKGAWPVETTNDILAFNEADVSDKPAWVANKNLTNATTQADRLRRQHMSLMAADDQIANLLDATGDRISNTIVVFMGDNGLMFGSHRITDKDVPYTMASEVPMYVRWDGHIAPATVTDRVTPQIDLTALIRDAAGISPDAWTMEGLNPLTTPREGVAYEQIKRNGHPAYCGWRTENYLYTKYSGTTGREFYDYAVDPEELTNVVNDPAYADLVAAHRAQAIASCLPVPPGFKW